MKLKLKQESWILSMACSWASCPLVYQALITGRCESFASKSEQEQIRIAERLRGCIIA